jgi:hypothetical protein
MAMMQCHGKRPVMADFVAKVLEAIAESDSVAVTRHFARSDDDGAA